MPRASIQIRVPFPDVDSSGRIHFTAMLRYMEVAEHELMRSIGFPYKDTLRYIALPRVHVSCDYRAAVYYDDILTIEARVEQVSQRSWTLAFTIFRQDEKGAEAQEIAAEGKMTIVAMDPQTERARLLPDDMRAALTGA